MEGHVLVVGTFEAAGTIPVGAQHVIVDEQVGRTQRFDPLGVGTDGTGIRSDFVMWEDRPEFHESLSFPGGRSG